MEKDLPSRLEQLSRILTPAVRAYLVGGSVRDSLLGLTVHDLDFVLERSAIPVARMVADSLQAAFYPLDVERDMGRVIVAEHGDQPLILDFSSQRGPDLESDLRLRDFTVNAIAIDLHDPQELIDPLGGAADLRAKLLRACSPDSFRDDPLRILRGIRLATAFQLRIDPETLDWMRPSIPALTAVSAERMRDELFRILEGPQPSRALRTLDYLGVLPYVLPELQALKGLSQPLPHTLDAWEHSLSAVQGLESVLQTLKLEVEPDKSASLFMGLVSLRLGRYREQLKAHLDTRLNPDRPLRGLLILASLYHDIGKAETRSLDEAGKPHFYGHEGQGSQTAHRRARELRLSNEESERLAAIVRFHMRPIFYATDRSLPSHRTVYRFFRDAGEAGVDACILSLADVIATYGTALPQDLWEHHLDVVRTLLEAWWEHHDERVSPPPLVNGDLLMESLGISPGPEVGRLLEAVREAQATGQVRDTEQALELAHSLIRPGNPDSMSSRTE